jgi:beta-N-acetylhexosaminidase
MVNHAVYPEKNKKLPASLSKEIVTEFLLNKWNYQGFSISDDLIMGAVSNVYNLTDACEKALAAGNHLFLICRPEQVAEVYAKLLRRVERSGQLKNAVYRNAAKILLFKYAKLGSAHKYSISREVRRMKALTEEVAQRAITLMRGQVLNFNLPHCTIFYPKTKWLADGETELTAFLNKRGTTVQQHDFPIALEEGDGISLAKQSKSDWNIVIVTNSTFHRGQMSLIEELIRRKKRVAVIGGGFPDDNFPEQVSPVIAAYWTSRAAMKAAARALFGQAKITGVLPFRSQEGS